MATEVSNHLDRIEDAKDNIITSIENKGVTVPSGTKIDGLSPYVDAIATASSVRLESNKDVIPSEADTIVKPSDGYAGLKQVTVSAIPSTYVGKDVPRKASGNLTASGATVTAPAGYYVKEATKTIPSATLVASGHIKGATTTVQPGTVSIAKNNTSVSGKTRVDITPTTESSSITKYYAAVKATAAANTTGNSVGTTGMAFASVSTDGYASTASNKQIELSGTFTATTGLQDSSVYYLPLPTSSIGAATSSTAATADRTIGYNQQTTIGAGYYHTDRIIRNSVGGGSVKVDADTITVTPSITVTTNGEITATVSGSKSIKPTVSAGYVTGGTAGTISVSGTGTQNLPTQSAKTITPTDKEQVAVEISKYTTGEVKVAAVPTETKTVTSSTTKQTLTPSTGKFFSQVIINGISTETKTAIPSETEQTITPSSGSVLSSVKVSAISNTYVGSGITRKGATTITPKASKQTAVSSGTYVTGDIEVAAIESASRARPTIGVSNTGLITATTIQAEGYVEGGTEKTTKQLPTATFTTSGNTVTSSSAGYVPANQTIATVSGGASLNTCVVRLEFSSAVDNPDDYVICYTSTDGSSVTANTHTVSGWGSYDERDVTLEDVLCGSVVAFSPSTYMGVDIVEGSGELMYSHPYNSCHFFKAPSNAGESMYVTFWLDD